MAAERAPVAPGGKATAGPLHADARWAAYLPGVPDGFGAASCGRARAHLFELDQPLDLQQTRQTNGMRFESGQQPWQQVFILGASSARADKVSSGKNKFSRRFFFFFFFFSFFLLFLRFSRFASSLLGCAAGSPTLGLVHPSATSLA